MKNLYKAKKFLNKTELNKIEKNLKNILNGDERNKLYF